MLGVSGCSLYGFVGLISGFGLRAWGLGGCRVADDGLWGFLYDRRQLYVLRAKLA